jgi:GDP-L-fucose synthase
MKLKVLVAGASGFIGMNLLTELSKTKSFELFGIYNKKKPNIKKIKYYKFDLENKANCLRATKDIDIVVMCAAKSSGAKVILNNPMAHLNPNIIMNTHMLEASYINKVKKFIFISSNTVYPNSTRSMKEKDSNYNFFEKYFIVGWMKKFSEMMCLMYSKKIKNPMQTLIIRPGNLYGPYDKYSWNESKVVAATIRKVYEKHNPIEVWGDGKDIKDFLYIDDFIACLVKLIKKNTGVFNIFNVASGKQTTINMVLSKLIKIQKIKNVNIVYNKNIPSLIPVRKIDISKIRKFVRWYPRVSLEKGLKKTLEWYKKNPK